MILVKLGEYSEYTKYSLNITNIEILITILIISHGFQRRLVDHLAGVGSEEPHPDDLGQHIEDRRKHRNDCHDDVPGEEFGLVFRSLIGATSFCLIMCFIYLLEFAHCRITLKFTLKFTQKILNVPLHNVVFREVGHLEEESSQQHRGEHRQNEDAVLDHRGDRGRSIFPPEPQLLLLVRTEGSVPSGGNHKWFGAFEEHLEFVNHYLILV
jgi:hypothetical protein